MSVPQFLWQPLKWDTVSYLSDNLWGLDGIWWSIVAAEVMAVAVTLAFLAGKRKKYGYL